MRPKRRPSWLSTLTSAELADGSVADNGSMAAALANSLSMLMDHVRRYRSSMSRCDQRILPLSTFRPGVFSKPDAIVISAVQGRAMPRPPG